LNFHSIGFFTETLSRLPQRLSCSSTFLVIGNPATACLQNNAHRHRKLGNRRPPGMPIAMVLLSYSTYCAACSRWPFFNCLVRFRYFTKMCIDLAQIKSVCYWASVALLSSYLRWSLYTLWNIVFPCGRSCFGEPRSRGCLTSC